MSNQSDRLSHTNDWVQICCTADEWEVRLIQATLGNQLIRCRPDFDRKSRQTTLFVHPEHQVEALELVSRIGLAITNNQDALQQFEEYEVGGYQKAHHDEFEVGKMPEPERTSLAKSTIAERKGIGKIIHCVGQGYKLEVGPEPHTIVEEAQWEDFSDFSAQRHEFSMLLRHEYPELFRWLKDEKLVGEFIRLVESTYREVPTTRLRGKGQSTHGSTSQMEPKTKEGDAKLCRLIKLSLWLSITSMFTLILQLPWYTSIVFSILAIGTGAMGKYRIGNSHRSHKGKLMAICSIIIACVVVVATVVYAQGETSPTESPPKR